MGGSRRALAIIVVLVAFSGAAAAESDGSHDSPVDGEPANCATVQTDASDETGAGVATNGRFRIVLEAVGVGVIVHVAGLSCVGDDAGERSAEEINNALGLVGVFVNEALDQVLP